ncbi:MAG: carotenoid biosynthesis protein [Candidatus Helarchaeota archaeon]
MKIKLDYDNKFLIILTTIVFLIIAITTIIHHIFPEVFRVPAVIGPYLIEPIIVDLLIMDLGASILSILLIYHGFKTIGRFKTGLFFYGAIVFAGLEECYWIIGGRFGVLPPTYFFTKGGLWFFEIPFFTCLGWFIISYCCYYIVKTLFPNQKYYIKNALAALIATTFDMFIDPVMVNLGSISIYPGASGMWVWLNTENVFRIFSIPFYNFFGWFMVVFMFLLLYNYMIDPQKMKYRGKTKTAIFFFLMIPLFLAILIGITTVVDGIVNWLLGGYDLIPIGVV